tara:strand:+ start:515 stop:841 length:327 start_codon:yes stop_codon:yes gene_type:complete
MKKILFMAIMSSSIFLSAFEINDSTSEMKISFTENPIAHALGIFSKAACDKVFKTQTESKNFKDVNLSSSYSSSMKCGFKPFPPFGCKIGRCMCDSNGRNCKWEVICE